MVTPVEETAGLIVKYFIGAFLSEVNGHLPYQIYYLRVDLKIIFKNQMWRWRSSNTKSGLNASRGRRLVVYFKKDYKVKNTLSIIYLKVRDHCVHR